MLEWYGKLVEETHRRILVLSEVEEDTCMSASVQVGTTDSRMNARGIAEKPAFSWWVPYTIWKLDTILYAVKSRIRRTTHNHGIKISTRIEHVRKVDAKNGDTLWGDAIGKEMFNMGIASEVLGEGKSAPPVRNKVNGHLVFGVKMEFTRKACYFLDGHKSLDLIGLTYAGVV